MSNLSDFDLIELLAIHESRENFWAFYQFMNPKIIKGWWQKTICFQLQDFYQMFIKGEKPQFVIEAPPQHGKSFIIVYFIAWLSGKNKDLKSIYVAYGQTLGIRANLQLQKIFESEKYKLIFGFRIKEKGLKNGEFRNKYFLDFIDSEGSFRNTTAPCGAITGQGLDIAVIDDPIKGRDAASSPAIRQKVWEWFTSDFYTRFSEKAGFITILTRWHIDDPVGRMLDIFPEDIRVISYPAIAVKDEKYRKKGEALFPALKSKEFILRRKKIMTSEEFESIYQQNPFVTGGEIIKTKYFKFYKVLPILKYRMAYLDTAQKAKEANDFSVCAMWGMGEDNKIYLIDLIRGKWEGPELERRVVSFWNKHNCLEISHYGTLRQLKIEDTAAGTGLIQKMKSSGGIPVKGFRPNKDKYTRVNNILGQIEAGFVNLPIDAIFLNDYLSECEQFTANDSHKHDDQIDVTVPAIDDMLMGRSKTWENLG